MQEVVDEVILSAEVLQRQKSSTLEKYRTNLRYFFTRTGIESIEDLVSKDIEEFIIKTRNRGAGNSFIANVLSSLRWFITRYEKKFGKLKNIRVVEVERPKVEHKPQSFLTVEELGVFVETIKNDLSKGAPIRKERFLALILLLMRSGARIAEALSINKDDINWEDHEVLIVGKGGKTRTLFLTQEVIEQLKKYLTMRTDSHPSLFVALNGKSRWAQTDLNRTFIRYVKLAGFKKHVTNHTLRRSFATILLESGASMNVVQRLMGHSSPIITLKYYINSAEEKKAKEAVRDEYFNFIPKA